MLYNLPVFLRMARAAKPPTNTLATPIKAHLKAFPVSKILNFMV